MENKEDKRVMVAIRKHTHKKLKLFCCEKNIKSFDACINWLLNYKEVSIILKEASDENFLLKKFQ